MSKETISIIKSQATELGENLFVGYSSSYKGLSGIYD
jgi:hypothetical protein